MADATNKAVFLSYASQDAEAAKRMADALRAAGVEVWFDAEGGLEHGDEWDAKIRRQIKECVLFIAVISANTQAREEGYFRIEWELAAQRALGIASGVAFILPVVIDDTKEPAALVPDRFRAVQWTKIPGGNIPPEVLQRFLKLWSHRTGALKHQLTESSVAGVADPGASRHHSGPGSATPATSTRRSVWPWIALGLVALVAAFFIFKPRRSPEEIARLMGEAQKVAVAAAQSAVKPAPVAEYPRDPELRRVRQLLYTTDAIPEDFRLAEDILKPVLARQPNDPETVTTAAEVALEFGTRGFDLTAARRTQIQRLTERAAQLAPDNPYALGALARNLLFTNAQLGRAEELIRQAIALRPDEARFHRTLYSILSNTRPAEADAQGERMAAQFPRDPLVLYDIARRYKDDNDLVRAEQWFDRTLALPHPPSFAFIWKAWFMAWVHGDLAGMKQFIDRVPDRQRANARVANARYVHGLFTGDTGHALQALSEVAEDWLTDFDFTGPKSLLIGFLRQRAGQADLARVQFEVALAATNAEIDKNPTDFRAQRAKLWALLGLGRLDEARAIQRVLLQAIPRPYVLNFRSMSWTNMVTGCLLLGMRPEALDLLRETCTDANTRLVLRNVFQLDPRLAPWRADPEILALLADPAEKPAAASPSPSLSRAPDDKSVAVLAFANLSDDKANEYFSDGISEELLNVLAKVPKLKVAARTSSFFFKGKEVPIPEIARQLGVAYVVEGSVRKAGNKVRVTAQLIKAADGFHVWSETYDRDLTDIFAVQDEIAKNILGVVKGSLMGEAELPHAATTNIEAYTLFLQAQGAFSRRGEAGLRESIRLYEAALAIAPDYVPALVGLAQARVVLPNYAYLSGAKGRATTEAALQAARRALELDPRNAGAFSVIGWAKFQFGWQWAESEEALIRARDLAPNDSWNWNCLGDYYRFIGDLPQALVAKQREWDLDPLSPNSQWDLSYLHLVAGNYDQAIQWGERSIKLAPHNVDSYMTGFLAAGRAGRFELMHRLLATARQNVHEGEGMLLLLEAYGAILEKKPADARRALAAAMPLAEDGTASPAYVGYCHLLLGDATQAAVWLRKGYDRSDPAMVWNEIIDFDVIAANPLTRPILDQPGLKELYDLRVRNARAGLSKL